MAEKTFPNLSKGINTLANDQQYFHKVDISDNSKHGKKVLNKNLISTENINTPIKEMEEKEIEPTLRNDSAELLVQSRVGGYFPYLKLF